MKPTKIHTLNEAFLSVAQMAQAASKAGTFGVAGLLLDAKGNVLHALANRVVEKNHVQDPTAHGERQLIDWYYEECARGATLPPPSELTIVSSLDPCCMCTGSILSAGFNVVVAAFDEYAGINTTKQADFPALSPVLREKAARSYVYPAIREGKYGRKANRALLPPFLAEDVAQSESVAQCQEAFSKTVQSVKSAINLDKPFRDLRSLSDLASDDPLLVALKNLYSDALAYIAPQRARPDVGLIPYLRSAAEKDRDAGGRGNAVAMLDGFGHLLLCFPGKMSDSPLQTPFMRLTRAYAQLRARLMEDPAIGEQKTRTYLGHPKHTSFIFLRSPDDSAESLIDLGAYGSSIEGELPEDNPAAFQYVLHRMPPERIKNYCAHLPLFYSQQVKVSPSQVEDEALIAEMGNFFSGF